jgi:hypothetical protein
VADPAHARAAERGGRAFDKLISQLKRSGSQLDLSGASLEGADFSGREVEGGDFSGADLRGASFSDARLSASFFANADLSGASFEGAQLVLCFFTKARLLEVDFTAAMLDGVHLDFANLAGASLFKATLRDVDAEGVDFQRVIIGKTTWGDVNLKHARNLDLAMYLGTSTIGIDTLTKSQGMIDESFLRGCGVPESVVVSARSLVVSATDLYSCFISYSSRDEDFSKRLHNDLRAAGVRCWIAAEDLKIGDRFRDEIESAIRMHDKLLLVLSDNSVQSDWVRSEVEGAFERETRERKQVLFPVRLDDAIIDTPKAWAADIRRQRHIGDFSGWKDHDSYKRAFDRLVRDLRATPSA